jgi:hypothetical protein
MIFGVLEDAGVLDAVDGLSAGGRWLSLGSGNDVGVARAVGRILSATLTCWPATTLTLSSAKPSAGCQARNR